MHLSNLNEATLPPSSPNSSFSRSLDASFLSTDSDLSCVAPLNTLITSPLNTIITSPLNTIITLPSTFNDSPLLNQGTEIIGIIPLDQNIPQKLTKDFALSTTQSTVSKHSNILYQYNSYSEAITPELVPSEQTSFDKVYTNKVIPSSSVTSSSSPLSSLENLINFYFSEIFKDRDNNLTSEFTSPSNGIVPFTISSSNFLNSILFNSSHLYVTDLKNTFGKKNFVGIKDKTIGGIRGIGTISKKRLFPCTFPQCIIVSDTKKTSLTIALKNIRKLLLFFHFTYHKNKLMKRISSKFS